MLRLRDDWKAILLRAWSVRLIAVAVVLSGAEAILPIVGYKLPLTDLWLAVLTFVVVTGAMIARIVAQQGIT